MVLETEKNIIKEKQSKEVKCSCQGLLFPEAEAKQRPGQLTSGYFGLLLLHKD